MTFHIGLNMAGAVSAGAYTAGVLDFLVEALDAWYAAKAGGADVPKHDVVLEVLSGASAGGMCAAISSVALQEQFPHVRAPNLAQGAPRNRLYRSWVETIDISTLLGTVDLDAGDGIVSVLDSSPIADIASQALKPGDSPRVHRQWVSDRLGVILTLTNLRGVPYSVDAANAGSFGERTLFHADRIEFEMANDGAQLTPTTYPLNYSDPNTDWTLLQKSAMATGAFPVMLAARTITRRSSEYTQRQWEIHTEHPDAQNGCTTQVTIDPAWGTDPASFDNVYSDGGLTNNNPFECARQFLVNRVGNPDGHNPRSGKDANAAVISVAPFPGAATWDATYNAKDQSTILNVFGNFVNALVDQSRFQGEDLILTRDEQVFSRFAIAPDDGIDDPQRPVLLCGALGAFGGFVDRAFREHDYQLGRRNCQQFLRAHFNLPGINPIIGKPDQPDTLFPIVPLMPGVSAEVPLPVRAKFCTTQNHIEQVAEAAERRAERLAHQLAAKHPVWGALIQASSLIWAGKLKDVVAHYLKQQLQGQIA